MPFDFNVDVKLTDADGRVQFINMTIAVVPKGAQQLSGEWRGAPVFVASSAGEFDWDGRPGQGAGVFDGPMENARFVLGLTDFSGPGGVLPATGASGVGSVTDPDDPSSVGRDVRWEIT